MFKESNKHELSFDDKKHNFFTKLGLRAKGLLRIHKEAGGLWEGPKSERWENVSKHCIVEAARAEVFADLLNLSPAIKEKLFAAAILHDFNKKDEILTVASEGGKPESFDKAYEKARQKLSNAGVDRTLIELVDSTGHASVSEMEEILRKSDLSEDEIAQLVIHYVDDYTIGSEWAEPYDGVKNDFDRRMDASEVNEKYVKIKEAGFYKPQRQVGNLVEQRLAKLIEERGAGLVEAKRLPEHVDAVIRERIEQVA